MLIYSGADLNPIGYTDYDFMSDKDSRKSTSGQYSLLVVELWYGEVSNNPASHILPWKLNI